MPLEFSQTPMPGESPAKTRPRRQNLATSPLLSLPRELRDAIYDFIFLSTRLSMGRLPVDHRIHMRIRPTPRSLSILGVCRQIRGEIGTSWLGKVLFNFED